MRLHSLLVLSLALAAISLSSEAFSAGPDADPSPGPWRGRLIDIETKEPIEGAVVVAVWERVWRTPAGSNVKFYEAKEVLTDKDGRYEVPAYKPFNALPLISYLRGPRFIIFKPGYLSIEHYLDENVTSTETELQERGTKYRLAPGIIEIPRAMTRNERVAALNAVEKYPVGYAPNSKLARLLESIRLENMNLGLKAQ